MKIFFLLIKVNPFCSKELTSTKDHQTCDPGSCGPGPAACPCAQDPGSQVLWCLVKVNP